MQEAINPFLALLLAHLLGDFVLQSRRVVDGKKSQRRRSQRRAYLEHGAIHYLSANLLLWLATPITVFSFPAQGILLFLVLLHIGVDVAKVGAIRRGRLSDGFGTFVLDQLVHLVILVLVALAMTGELASGPALTRQLLRSNARQLLAFAAVYTGVVFGGGYLIGHFLKPFAAVLPPEEATAATGLEKAGLYIGWIERFLVLTGIAMDSPATIGLIIAAKSVFRFSEIKGRPFAEYFLIGTLSSVALAALGGLLLKGLLAVY